MEILVSMVSLGCPKNQVDGEMLLSKVAQDTRYILTTEPEKANIVIINTCGFIEAAKKESIETILEYCQLKEYGIVQKVVVSGCLAERYKEEIKTEIPEVDGVIGIGSNKDIIEGLDTMLKGESFLRFGKKTDLDLNQPRILTTPNHYAYLKIAEGCDNGCTFCAIPLIRGRFRSRPMESILDEAKALGEMGVKELLVVAQDTTRYGEDIYGEYKIHTLLENLCKIPSIQWIRLMYCYPERIQEELLEVMAREDKIVKYMELPIQHCDEEILKKMRRVGTESWMRELIQSIQSKVPNITIRTTLITGFPTETQEQFTALHEFVKDMKFPTLGCFSYSKEEGTPSAKMDGQVPQEVKDRRAELIMQDQILIMEKINQSYIGKTLPVLIEEKTATGYQGRTTFQAPEIDGVVIIHTDSPLSIGEFAEITITDCDEFDLFGIVS